MKDMFQALYSNNKVYHYNDIENNLVERNINIVRDDIISSINKGAFTGCASLTSIEFPNCTIIGNSAFALCYSLTSAIFPNCTAIDDSAFWYCDSLTSVIFPNCTAIGSYAF